MSFEPKRITDLSSLSTLFYLRRAVQEHLVQALNHYLEIPHIVNCINKNAIELGQLDWQKMDSLHIHFFRQMKLFPGLSGIQLGTEAGDYIGVLDLGNRTPTLEIKQHLSSGHKYVYSLDNQGNLTQTCLGCSHNYEPRTRPWYLTASDRNLPGWSEVYQYSSDASVQLGVMATLPVLDNQGKRIGVLGCDVALTHISEVLSTLTENLIGTYCLIERNGQIIGSSVHPRPFTIENGQAVRLSARDCGSPILEAAIQFVDTVCGDIASIQQHQDLEFTCCGKKYFINVSPLHPDVGLDWLLITCIATSDLSLAEAIDASELLDSFAFLQQTNQSLQEQVRRHTKALKESKRALRNSEERWLLALQGTNDGLWDWHIETNEVFFSDRWLEISGYQAGELAHHFEEWKQHIHAEDAPKVMAAIDDHLLKKTAYYAMEHRTRCKDGSYKWVLDRGRALWNEKGIPVRMVGSRSDITERKRMEARLIYQAEHDSLTGLLNRSALLKHLDFLLQSPGNSFYLIFIDIDRFKAVNDSLGHTVGDQLLVNFAYSLRKLTRPDDRIARLSGDEFVLLLLPEEDFAIDYLVERIKVSLQQVAIHLNLRTPISVSIGVTSSYLSTGNPQDFLRDADIAMYSAKFAGGNQHAVYHPALREESFKHLLVELALKEAIEKQEFLLYFQPILCLEKLVPVGLEALVRWPRSSGRIVSPAEFIPVAEKSGLIIPVGHWILEQSCQQLKQWHKQYSDFLELTLNINVSVKQFYEPNFIETIDRLLETYEIPANSLRLEITESCFMERAEVALKTMEKLHQRGIRLCIDDFGTGYSSLSYLHQLPVESLKIDQSFVARVVNSDQGMAMVKAILAMSQSLGVQVVAEGIETSEQLIKLQQLGCRYGQGYLFSEPNNAHVIDQWLSQALRSKK